jgi:hypothetical protein
MFDRVGIAGLLGPAFDQAGLEPATGQPLGTKRLPCVTTTPLIVSCRSPNATGVALFLNRGRWLRRRVYRLIFMAISLWLRPGSGLVFELDLLCGVRVVARLSSAACWSVPQVDRLDCRLRFPASLGTVLVQRPVTSKIFLKHAAIRRSKLTIRGFRLLYPPQWQAAQVSRRTSQGFTTWNPNNQLDQGWLHEPSSID